jgi:hypothetical protein
VIHPSLYCPFVLFLNAQLTFVEPHTLPLHAGGMPHLQLIASPVEVDEEPISVCVNRNDFVGLVQLVCQRLSVTTDLG